MFLVVSCKVCPGNKKQQLFEFMLEDNADKTVNIKICLHITCVTKKKIKLVQGVDRSGLITSHNSPKAQDHFIQQ